MLFSSFIAGFCTAAALAMFSDGKMLYMIIHLSLALANLFVVYSRSRSHAR